MTVATEQRPDVTYGQWEPDPDAAPIYAGISAWRGDYTILRPQTGGYRRRRFERWFDAEGREMGRWTWERRTA